MTWETVPLGRLISDVTTGFASRDDLEDGVFQIRMNNLTSDSRWDWTRRRRVSPTDRQLASSLVAPGDVIFNATNSPELVGKSGLMPDLDEPAVISNHFLRIRVRSEVLDPGYLRHWLLLQFARGIFRAKAKAWINQATLDRRVLLEMRIPLPPRPEQRRIAAILDEADRIRRTFARGERLWQSVTEGLLRSVLGGAQGFTSLGSHLRETQNGLYKPSSDYGSGTPIIRIDSFEGGIAGVTQPLKRVRISESERAKFAVVPGQILVNRVNALSHLGKSTLIQDLGEPTIFESNMMRLDLATSIEPRYVFAWLASGDARNQIRSRAKKAINQASINQTDVAELRIPSISIEKQREFVSRLAEIEQARASSEARATHLDALFTSLQHRAFRGEL